MPEQANFLVKTLVQRGESDTYIQQRLMATGLKEAEAKALIYETRLYNEAVHPHLMNETEAVLIALGMLALLVLLVWILLVSF